MSGQLGQRFGDAFLVEGWLARSLSSVDKNEFTFVLRQIEPIPKLIGLAAGIGEPIRLDVVAENELGGIGVRILRRDASRREQDKHGNDASLE